MIEVCAGIIQKDGKILIARRKLGAHLEGMWEFPGGKVEIGESHEQCLRRELFEEFGIETTVGDFVAQSIFDYGKGKEIRLSGYLVAYLSGEFVLNDHSEICWIDAAEFDNFDFAPADLPILEVLKKNMV